ncbi:MAG TPA: serine hydrolase domain-containing protein [Armatimonadota bacterium]
MKHAPIDGAAARPPETRAGRHLAGWLDALNSGDLDTLRRFTEQAYAPNTLAMKHARVRSLRGARLFQASHGLDFAALESGDLGHVQMLLRSRVGADWWRVRVEVEPDSPHRIRELALYPVPEPRDGRSALSLPEAAARLEAYLEELSAAGVFSGAALLAEDGVPVMQRAYGFASQGFGAPNRVDTKFNLGSMNKMFTAVAIAQLVGEGRLTFDTTVGEAVAGYPNREAARAVTVHHLLSHTSGMGNFFTQEFNSASRERFRTVRDLDPLYVDAPLRFPPGERYHYSNAGFALLGRIVEEASGEDYFERVRRCIYEPAGMRNTDSYEMDVDTPNRAIGYTNLDFRLRYRPGPKRTNTFIHIVRGTPAGGGFSTVGDMLRFHTALRAGSILAPELVEALWTPRVQADAESGVWHGYGAFLETVNGTRIAGHAGVFAGLNSQIDMYRDRGLTCVVMSNFDPPLARRVCNRVREWLT